MSQAVRVVIPVLAILALAIPLEVVVAQPPRGGEPESPLLRDPDTPEGAFNATMLMIDIGRPRLARRYLALFDSLMPDDDTLLDLREKKGIDAFLKLSNVRELQPQSVRLLDRVNAAFRRRAQDPDRVDALIAQLAGTPQEQATAIVSLREGGADIVPRLLQSANDRIFKSRREGLVLAITRIGPEAVPPVVAALQATDEGQQVLAIETLGWLGTKENLVDLWYTATADGQPPGTVEASRTAIRRILGRPETDLTPISTDGVVRSLLDEARRGFAPAARQTGADAADEPRETWTWVPADNRVARTNVDPALVALHRAVRYSWQAVRLAPENQDAQALQVAARGGYDLARNGWGNGMPTGPGTAHDLASTAGPETVARGLETALESGNPLASMAMLTVLARIGRAADLYDSESPSPIITALNDADSRVRFSAANTVLALDPRKPFPKSSRVVEILVRTLTDGGRGRVAVVDADIARARTMASLFGDLGFDVDSARTGKDGFRLAAGRGDIEFVALQANVARWDLTQTIANLRADARTKAVPIVVYGDPEFPTRNVDRLRQRYEPIRFIDFSIREETTLGQMRPFVTALQSPIEPEQRAEQVSVALYWLARIGDGNRTDVFDISSAESALFALANDPELGPEALIALAAIPRGSAQLRLQEIALNSNKGTEIQRRAAFQLAAHIQRYGLLLSGADAAAVVRAWESAGEPGLVSALATVVGTLKPNTKLVSERISEVPPPPLP